MGRPTPRRRTPAMQVQRLQKSVYDLQGMLLKAKRRLHHDGTLPWEEVARALQEDMLEKVREHRLMRQHVEQHQRMCEALQAWIHTMYPPQRTPATIHGTWKDCYLFQGNADVRREAQAWMVRQAYHNTRRAMAAFPFPDTADTCVQIEAAYDEDLMTIHGAMQCTFPYSLDAVSRALWVVENTFTDYVRKQSNEEALPTSAQIQRLAATRVRYHREEDPSPGQKIRKNSLHGQIEDADSTTTIFRTIVHDEAFPLGSSSDWIIDVSEWSVAERVGPASTRLRGVYTVRHPMTCTGPVPLEKLAHEMHIPIDERMRARLCARLEHGHARQRRIYLDYVTKVLAHMGEESGEAILNDL